MTNTKLSKLFITGCDSKTAWMLPWFEKNFYKHNPNAQLFVYDFDSFDPEQSGWFKKPAAMLDAAQKAKYVCWIDTDCEVRGNIENIFDYVETNKLAMVEDVPWSKRRGEKWHNSGIVAFESTPSILRKWKEHIKSHSDVGDQEVLHNIIREGMMRLIHITDLPRRFNTLRLDLQDGTAPSNIKVMHWTGAKGKAHIKEIMND